MIIIKKKVLFIFFLIIFFINIFLISKRRDFNFYYIKSFLHHETYSQINENSNIKNAENNNYELNNIYLIFKKNKIKEINIDSNILKKNLNIEDLVFYFYPTKFSTGSHYVIGYFNDRKYDKCKNLGLEPIHLKDAIENKFFDTHLTVYACE